MTTKPLERAFPQDLAPAVSAAGWLEGLSWAARVELLATTEPGRRLPASHRRDVLDRVRPNGFLADVWAWRSYYVWLDYWRERVGFEPDRVLERFRGRGYRCRDAAPRPLTCEADAPVELREFTFRAEQLWVPVRWARDDDPRAWFWAWVADGTAPDFVPLWGIPRDLGRAAALPPAPSEDEVGKLLLRLLPGRTPEWSWWGAALVHESDLNRVLLWGRLWEGGPDDGETPDRPLPAGYRFRVCQVLPALRARRPRVLQGSVWGA